MRTATLILLAGAFCSVALSNGQDTCTPQPFRDGWKVLQGIPDSYLAYVTHNDTSRQCFTMKRLSINRTDQSVVFLGTYQMGADATVYNTTITARVQKACSQVVDFTYANNPGVIYSSQLLYSDYRTCKLLTNAFHSPGCQLFVAFGTGYLAERSCEEKLSHYCGSAVYDVYDEKRCHGRP